LVVDTSVFVSALISAEGASRQALRLCLNGTHTSLMGEKLFLEYEDVFGRWDIFERSPLNSKEREEVLNGFLSVCEWTPIYFLWRPNLPDEGGNHLVELAVSGGADAIVTHNIKDFTRGVLRFPDFEILTPKELLNR
jgi:putative PIN family toxin of toxin-antitoxin system